MWRLIYLNQHLKSAFTSISWSRKKNLPHANYVFTLVHHSGTNLYILYIIPSYCENESIANVSCATTTCIVQIFITNWIILSRVMSNIFLKLQYPGKNWPEILFYTPFLNLSAIKTCKLLTLVRPSVRFGHLKKTTHFVLKNNQQKTIPNVIQGVWHIIIFPKGFTS